MKTVFKWLLFLIVSVSLQSCLCIFGDCNNPPLPPPVEQFKPVLLDRPTFENSIQIQPAQSIVASGKIYIRVC